MEELFIKHQKAVHDMAIESGLSDADAQQLVETVFLKAAEKLATFDTDKGTIKGWLLALTRKCLIERLRKQRH